jgi:hypothetical protein
MAVNNPNGFRIAFGRVFAPLLADPCVGYVNFRLRFFSVSGGTYSLYLEGYFGKVVYLGTAPVDISPF